MKMLACGGARNKFDVAMKNFFNFADVQLHESERLLLRDVYRNGMAHNFTIQGNDVAIDYQKAYGKIDYLFFIDDYNHIVFNVNKMLKISHRVFERLPNETSKHSIIEVRYSEYISYISMISNKPEIAIQTFRAYEKTRNRL